MTIVQTNSLPLPLETFTQPCAEQRKSLVEQTEEITVELLLESNDIQLFGNKLRFLVAPQNERELQQCTDDSPPQAFPGLPLRFPEKIRREDRNRIK